MEIYKIVEIDIDMIQIESFGKDDNYIKLRKNDMIKYDHQSYSIIRDDKEIFKIYDEYSIHIIYNGYGFAFSIKDLMFYDMIIDITKYVNRKNKLNDLLK